MTPVDSHHALGSLVPPVLLACRSPESCRNYHYIIITSSVVRLLWQPTNLWQWVRRQCAHKTTVNRTLQPSRVTREVIFCTRMLSLLSVSARHVGVLSTSRDFPSPRDCSLVDDVLGLCTGSRVIAKKRENTIEYSRIHSLQMYHGYFT